MQQYDKAAVRRTGLGKMERDPIHRYVLETEIRHGCSFPGNIRDRIGYAIIGSALARSSPITAVSTRRHRHRPWSLDEILLSERARSRMRIGVFSALLAPRCESLVAADSSTTAVAEAARQALLNVRFKKACLPDEFPDGTYDLIVLSEVLYYFSEQDLRRLANRCLETLAPDGEMILCHWLGETDYPLTGHQASDLFAEAVARCRPVRVRLHEGIYRLERFSFAQSFCVHRPKLRRQLEMSTPVRFGRFGIFQCSAD